MARCRGGAGHHVSVECAYARLEWFLVLSCRNEADLMHQPMSKSDPIPFNCPCCETEYKIVTIAVRDYQQGRVGALSASDC
jgi:hypothetical protein